MWESVVWTIPTVVVGIPCHGTSPSVSQGAQGHTQHSTDRYEVQDGGRNSSRLQAHPTTQRFAEGRAPESRKSGGGTGDLGTTPASDDMAGISNPALPSAKLTPLPLLPILTRHRPAASPLSPAWLRHGGGHPP